MYNPEYVNCRYIPGEDLLVAASRDEECGITMMTVIDTTLNTSVSFEFAATCKCWRNSKMQPQKEVMMSDLGEKYSKEESYRILAKYYPEYTISVAEIDAHRLATWQAIHG